MQWVTVTFLITWGASLVQVQEASTQVDDWRYYFPLLVYQIQLFLSFYTDSQLHFPYLDSPLSVTPAEDAWHSSQGRLE